MRKMHAAHLCFPCDDLAAHGLQSVFCLRALIADLQTGEHVSSWSLELRALHPGPGLPCNQLSLRIVRRCYFNDLCETLL